MAPRDCPKCDKAAETSGSTRWSGRLAQKSGGAGRAIIRTISILEERVAREMKGRDKSCHRLVTLNLTVAVLHDQEAFDKRGERSLRRAGVNARGELRRHGFQS
jgi:hypothetical protein